jgi:hypothetical protein
MMITARGVEYKCIALRQLSWNDEPGLLRFTSFFFFAGEYSVQLFYQPLSTSTLTFRSTSHNMSSFPIELKPRRRYSSFYEQTRECPEIQRFRRFTAESAWTLDCQLMEIQELERLCVEAMNRSGELPSGGHEYSIMDWKPAMTQDKKIRRLMLKYQNRIRRYSE